MTYFCPSWMRNRQSISPLSGREQICSAVNFPPFRSPRQRPVNHAKSAVVTNEADLPAGCSPCPNTGTAAISNTHPTRARAAKLRMRLLLDFCLYTFSNPRARRPRRLRLGFCFQPLEIFAKLRHRTVEWRDRTVRTRLHHSAFHYRQHEARKLHAIDV